MSRRLSGQPTRFLTAFAGAATAIKIAESPGERRERVCCCCCCSALLSEKREQRTENREPDNRRQTSGRPGHLHNHHEPSSVFVKERNDKMMQSVMPGRIRKEGTSERASERFENGRQADNVGYRFVFVFIPETEHTAGVRNLGTDKHLFFCPQQGPVIKFSETYNIRIGRLLI